MMGIKIYREGVGWDALNVPQVACDACDEPIAPGEPAIVAWPMDGEYPQRALRFYHKPECDPRHKHGPTAWMDLGEFLRYLHKNTSGGCAPTGGVNG